MLEFREAFERLAEAALSPRGQDKVESLPLAAACGRFAAQEVHAASAVPGFDNSAMDGYAVRLDDIRVGNPVPLRQRIAAGETAEALAAGGAARIFTGAMLPAGADTVILQENAEARDGKVFFQQLPERGANVRRAGEDFNAGAQLVQRGERLTAADIGRLAAAGLATVPVFPRLRVAFFSSGDELAEPGAELLGAQVYNSNRYALAQQLRALCCEPLDLGCCPDNHDQTVAFLREAAALSDCVISTGGMSVGEEDHVRAAAASLGEIDFWKIAMKPGKPLAFGKLGATPFFGLPGNPVSAFVTFQLLVRPWLLRRCGAARWRHQALIASASEKIVNRGGRLDFRRCTLGADNSVPGMLSVRCHDKQGSGMVSSLAESNALLPVAAHSEIAAGDSVKVIALDGEFNLAGGEPWP